MVKFPGFDADVDRKAWTTVVQIPERIYSLDGKRFVKVSLDAMSVPSDERGTLTFKWTDRLQSFSSMTLTAGAFVLLEALDGKRKSSTVYRWLNELSLFGRTVSGAIKGHSIKTITLKMYQWYSAQKNASQQKLLRSTLLYWIEAEVPGLHQDLVAHLRMTAPPKPRGMIEVQNAVPAERPLTMGQVQGLLDNVADLFLAGTFDPQDNLLWRLMISEALRPSQMRLLQVGDVKINRNEDGRIVSVRLMVPMVKQSGIAARDYMHEHALSTAVSQALVDHLEYIDSVHGAPVPKTWAIFCVRRAKDKKTRITKRTSIDISDVIAQTRRHLTALSSEFVDTDLFNRRFKHTKLTHLAAAGAPLEVLAYAGYQTSTVSLVRYVNLTEEAFVGFEEKLDTAYQHIEDSFRGRVIDRAEATHQDPEHRIADPSMEDDVGACADEPCEFLACLGCYGCPRFEAFKDGPHERVEAKLVSDQARARAAGMPEETVHLNDRTLAAVRRVIQIARA